MNISKVNYKGNTLIDLTSDSVTSENLLTDITAHAANGNQIIGNFNPMLNSFCGSNVAVLNVNRTFNPGETYKTTIEYRDTSNYGYLPMMISEFCPMANATNWDMVDLRIFEYKIPIREGNKVTFFISITNLTNKEIYCREIRYIMPMINLRYLCVDEILETRTLVPIPTLISDTLVYNGNSQSPFFNSYDPSLLEISDYYSHTDVGTYYITAHLKDTTNYLWEDGHTSDRKIKWSIIEPAVKSWATASDEEVAQALEAHYNGEINIYDYWHVGDERVVSLAAMSATGVGESHVAQNVTLVLMNEGGKTLVTPINGHTECVFIVGQKEVLNNGTARESGYMNSSNTNSGGWNSSARRAWCNSVYKNALPSTLVGIFKQHQNITANGSNTDTIISNDYFALPSEKEVFGQTTYANATAEASNTQFKYYETSSNRIKKSYYWWERSPISGSSTHFCSVDSVGNAKTITALDNNGIAPFGCI